LARYDIVPDRSQVWIDATSNVHPIHTRTDGVEGFLEVAVEGDGELDLDVAPQGRLSLPVARLSSGNALEDRELQRRVDARRFRTIDGRLSHIKAAGGDGRYLVRGDVTFRGVTNSYEEEMTVARLDEWTLQLEGRATFDIRDFGMDPPRLLMLKVDPEVDVRVAIVARRER